MSMIVGIMAERWFHYDVKEVAESGINHDLENAASLSSALLVALLVPWGLCFFFYFGALGLTWFLLLVSRGLYVFHIFPKYS